MGAIFRVVLENKIRHSQGDIDRAGPDGGLESKPQMGMA